jgi:alpha-L-fucosidase 2
MSYWPGYAANHLEESSVFTDWLWKFQDTAAKFSESFFKCEGNNFPGVSTLTGQPMGGWIQYAFSPTTSCWLSHHFYLQWKYSMDQDFLIQRAYPFLKQTGLFIDRISIKEGRFKRLPISSSPEFDDNSIKAWHSQTTNYDLSLIRNLYESLTEMAMAAGNEKEAGYWQKLLSGWPELSLSASKSLMVAPGYPYTISHRHFSHLMAIYPLGLIDRLHGLNEERIIEASLSELEKNGTSQWCGYSYAWLGNLMARSGDGEKAAAALRTFASCFCSPNSFHLNGDQSGTGKSSYTYRPFTLEGNFAFASGVEEMLLQSHDGVIRIFPAIPASWDTVSFKNLRAQGAFLVSATRSGGKTLVVTMKSEKGGTLVVENPFTEKKISVTGTNRVKFLKSGFLEIETQQDDYITFSF